MIVCLNSSALARFSEPCADLRNASTIVRSYIKRHDLGASDMRFGFGNVSDDAGKNVGHISYNGRIWVTDANGNKAEVTT